MKRHLYILLFLGFGISPLALFAQSAKKMLKEAQLLYASNQYQQSAELCSKVLTIDPANADAFQLRARSNKELKNYQDAIRDYNAALNDMPKNERILGELAFVYGQAGERKDAIQVYDRILNLNTRSSAAYQGKAIAQLELRDFGGAYQTAVKGLEVNKTDAKCAHIIGLATDSMGNLALAESSFTKALSIAKSNKEYKSNPILLKNFYSSLASVKIRLSKPEEALIQLNEALIVAPDDYSLYNQRAAVKTEKLDLQEALTDLNKSIALQPKNPEAFYLRGNLNNKLGQFSAAISDFNQAILLNNQHIYAIAGRASCQFNTGMYNEAVRDYQKALELKPNDPEIKKGLLDAKSRQYEANAEAEKPRANMIKPAGMQQDLVIRGDAGIIDIEIQVMDASGIKSFIADGQSIQINEEAKNPLVSFSFNPAGKENLEVRITDIYLNTNIINWKIIRTEIDPPSVRLTRPIQSLEGNTIYIENKPTLMVEGKVRDASLIRSIIINESTASYPLDQKDPAFQAIVSIGTKDTLTVRVTDIVGNESLTHYKVVREDTSGANPMGITWVVFIENSNYKNLQRLEGPSRDVSEMKSALANYRIDNVLHKKDLTKAQLDRFFSIDLRDQVQKNRVKSLIIWYAGHGKFLNETGYWIPVDGDTYEEFTYYSVNNLRASMQAYTMLKHVLVVSDACESGPAFYMAMRDDEIKNRQCNDWEVTKYRSAQVMTSSNKELSSDNSLFTQAFANTLNNNPNDCISIEYVANKVSGIVKQNQKQTPKFGKIKGLDDENGTFFFIKKDF
jgi:tetratricopeptide (TPR) repeat protein